MDAKDIYLQNNMVDSQPEGYRIRDKNGKVRIGKFINTLDNNLDLPVLRNAFFNQYRTKKFSFRDNGKEYTQQVINVTFNYTVKLFNKISKDFYVRFGYNVSKEELVDGVCIKNGILVAVATDYEFGTQVEEDMLENSFVISDGKYKAKTNIPIVKSVSELRGELYDNGFLCDGIRYIRFKRSSGSSRTGKCLFINADLYDRMHRWEMCSLKIKEEDEVDLAALEAYISLTLSSIIGTVTIKPENILVINDYTSVFKERAVVTDIAYDEEGNPYLRSEPREVQIENSIWDGQSLIEADLTDGHGMALLRNRFFKSCCFATNIQKFFKDYGITSVDQLKGKTLASKIEDIKLITTPSSIKYLKFGTLSMWMRRLSPEFGIVKHEKPTHLFDGRMVQVHYQLLNTLQLSMEDMEQLLAPSIKYMTALRNDPSVVMYHIKKPNVELDDDPMFDKNEITFKLMGLNDKFCKTKLYHDFVTEMLKAYSKNIRRGHVYVNGNYSTLFGNPMEMLLSTIGQFDGTSRLGVGNIHTKRFEYGKTILGTRSPHVTMGNVWLPYNIESEELDRYFALTDEIVCINSIDENTLQRLSGADFDSDTSLLTDNPILIAAAQKHYHHFLVPTSAVEAKKTKRRYTNQEKADLDIRTSENKIGEIINLAQRLNSMLWDNVNNGQTIEENMDLYCDIAKLDVMSGIEIDKAKKEFVVNNSDEIAKLKKKYFEKKAGEKNIKPNFFAIISRSKGYYDPKKNDYKFHKTSMDYLQKVMNKVRLSRKDLEVEPFSYLVIDDDYNVKNVNYRQVHRIMQKMKEFKMRSSEIWTSTTLDSLQKMESVTNLYSETVAFVESMQMNHDTMLHLLRKLESSEFSKIRRPLMNVLFSAANQDFFKLLRSSQTEMPTLVEDEDGDIEYYGIHFKKV